MKNIFIILLFIIIQNLKSDPIKTSDNLEQLNLIEYEDQFGDKKEILNSDKILIFSSDMDGTKIAHEFFELKGVEYLKNKNAIFIGDIHRMPWLISKFIAIPKMRKYAYTIYLIKDDKKGENFLKEKGKLTGYYLDKFEIKKMVIISNKEELEKFIESFK